MEARPAHPGGSERERESIKPPSVPAHELLRCIGQGSYGEVWLARNVLGAFRAVKIVYRRNFDHDRPFDREFAGIQKFEPISRLHEGFVDLLQVGRDDPRGCFYYVMELADQGEPGPNVGRSSSLPGQLASLPNKPLAERGAAPPAGVLPAPLLNTDSYAPRTLRSAIQQRGRLPLSECIKLGLSLTSAVAFLHQQGLVHRDIKPSNIVFIGGQPKLADVGLVAGANEARSFVGTEGFIPPEGPGTPQADLYSLGIVLYQMSTGKSHQAFPEPLEDLASQPDHAHWLEFNAVIHKACAADARERYQSAEEMQVELVLLQRGESVKRKRVVEQRIALAKLLGLVTATISLFLTGIWLLSSRFNHSTVQPLNASSLPAEVNSIAVLPFVNQGKSSGHEYLSDALSDETMNALTNVAGLRVAPRHGAFAFKRPTNDLRHVGQHLGVRTVLAGTFLRTSNGMHLTARLLNVADGVVVWSNRFDGGREELSSLGIDLIASTTQALGYTLTDAVLGRARTNLTRKLAAYKLYSQASTNWMNTQDGLNRGIQLLNRAIAEDQNYAQAYAALAYRYQDASAFYLPQAQAMTAAKMNALRALELDDALSAAHRALAMVFWRHELDLAKAESHFQRALEVAPNDGGAYGDYAAALAHFGLFDKADQVLKRGEQVDPTAHNLLGAWFWPYYLKRDFAKAKQAATRLQTVHPDSVIGSLYLAMATEGLRRYDEALPLAEKSKQMDPAPDVVALIGRLHARLGHREEALKALEELRVLSRSPRGALTFSAEVLFALGENNRAIESLQRAVDEYPPTVLLLKANPFWDDLRADLRFETLLKKAALEK